MSSAGKLVMLALISVVCGQCEDKCHCTKYKVFCSLARIGALPTRIPNTTELVKIEFDNIPRISTTMRLENITHLQLVSVALQEIQPGAFENMSRLEYLAITGNNITLLETDSFKYLNMLYSLNLSDNGIEHVSRATFSGLQNLRFLDLSHNYIKNIETKAFEGMRWNEVNFIGCPVIEPGEFKYLSTLTYFHISPYVWKHIPKHTSFAARISSGYDIEFVNRNNKHVMSELLYLDLASEDIKSLNEMEFQNFTKLTYLDLSSYFISEIKCGVFEGLVSLKTLKMNNNFIRHLNNGTFHELPSLEILILSRCHISTIESRAFEGLSKLRTLDLSWNEFNSLHNFTFSSLRMLQELRLEGNAITHIDYGCFGDLRNLKSLLNSPLEMTYLADKHDIQHLKSLNTVSEKTFVQLQRLDNLRLFRHIRIPKEIQVLNALHLYIHAGYDDPQKELRRVLQTVRYVRNLSITLFEVKSTQLLVTFNEFRISELIMSLADPTFVNSKSLCCLSRLTSLTLHLPRNSTIEGGSFRGFEELRQLSMYYEFSFTITYGLFLGLKNLRFLSIGSYVSSWNPSAKTNTSLGSGVFLGMDNLTQLHLMGNYITGLKPGAFQGLDKIERLDLSKNKIGKIEAGVFGAMCKGEFEMSCKNVTLPEYCNNTNALKTLKYLNLYYNFISHIHPHAFVSCTNLQTLVLSHNKFLNLDIPFLYTPGLRKLDMSWCSITNIPNDTFACTPLLSEIDFQRNKNMSKLTVSVLLPLRHLQNIDLRYINLSRDCQLYEAWMWMRLHRINHNNTPIKGRYIFAKMVDAELSNMTCNSTITNIFPSKNLTSDKNDFAFFKQYIEPIVLIIILTFGLVSNGFLLFIALRHSDMRTKQNACIIHLSTVELLSLVLNLPLSYWDVVNIRWEFDDTLCKTFIFSKDVGVAVTALATVALSVERFLVARNFGNLRKICKSETQPTAWLLLMTWVSAIVTSLPAYFSAGVFEGRCLYCPPGNQSYIRNVWTFQLIMYCLLTVLAITFLNVKTSVFLRQSIRKIPGEIKETDRVKNRRKVANVTLILVLVFIVSYMPNYILRCLVSWSLVDMKVLFLPSFFTFCLFFCYPIFNPISIFIMSSKFKSYAFRYFPFLENSQDTKPVPRILNGKVRRHK